MVSEQGVWAGPQVTVELGMKVGWKEQPRRLGVSSSERTSSLARQLPEKDSTSAEQNSPRLCCEQEVAPSRWGA